MPIRSRLTFANVVSLIALFAAIGLGTAFALERNSVESRHIANDQVKPADIADIKALENSRDVILSDSNTDSDPSEETVASARGFKFTGRCLDLSGNNTATLLVEPEDPATSWSFDSTANNGSDDQPSLTGVTQATVIQVGPTGGQQFQSGSWAIGSGDGSGRETSLHGLVSAGIETAHDCTFALTIVG